MTTFVPLFKGGLGNQLFQLAYCYELAHRFGGEVAVDLARPHFAGQGEHPSNYCDTFLGGVHLIDLRSHWRTSEIVEGRDIPDRLLPVCTVDGYWQNPNGWQDPGWIREQLRWFTPVRREVTCIHVRGGDYNRLRHIYPEVTSDHYQSHLSGDEAVEVHTDDLYYSQCLLPNVGRHQIGDFIRFGQASKAILSNSTWAWWAAFLGEVPEVVMPPHWINLPHAFNHGPTV